jgi:hypothetical protein
MVTTPASQGLRRIKRDDNLWCYQIVNINYVEELVLPVVFPYSSEGGGLGPEDN